MVDPKQAPSPQHHLVILCHPSVESLNAEIARVYAETVKSLGHEAVIRDLYRLNFDPLLKETERAHRPGFTLSKDVEDELALIENADAVILVYPIWFGTPPAMMKGYVERVFGAGLHYRSMGHAQGHNYMQGRHLLSITTSGKTIEWLEMKGAWMSLLTIFDRYLAQAFLTRSNDHLHLDDIFETMKQRHVDEELHKVREKARSTVARLEPAASTHEVQMARL